MFPWQRVSQTSLVFGGFDNVGEYWSGILSNDPLLEFVWYNYLIKLGLRTWGGRPQRCKVPFPPYIEDTYYHLDLITLILLLINNNDYLAEGGVYQVSPLKNYLFLPSFILYPLEKSYCVYFILIKWGFRLFLLENRISM